MNINSKVSDPSDYSKTKLPQLSQLDSLLRCHICKDFIKVPVLTPCGHTFCSLCIRGYIDVKARCPLCLNELRESMLRGDILVNEVVLCYKSLRDSLIQNLEEVKEVKLEESGIPEIVEVVPEDPISQESEDDIQIISTNTNTSPGANNRWSSTAASSRFNHISLRGKEKDSDRDKVSKRDSSRIQSLLKKKLNNPSKQLAQCPICAQFFPIQTLERVHLDECLTMKSLEKSPKPVRATTPETKPKIPSSSSTKLKTRSSEGPLTVSHTDRYVNSSINKLTVQRLPKLDLTSMTLSQIKQKLSSLGLPTNGSKPLLIERYNYYQMIWNSNFCDSSDPVDETELRRQLMSWEASRNLNVGHSNSNSNGTSIGVLLQKSNLNRHQGNSYVKLLNDFKTDKFDRKQWMVLFRKQFKHLTKEARSRKDGNKITKDAVEQHTQKD